VEQTLIALDIETTGFDSNKDQVIEIAAVKFKGNETIDTFETLINPERDIPTIITHITGIKNKDLENAPYFEDIREELERFIDNHPIVGHNISFDVNFLNQKGLSLKNDLYDTLDLASILLPGMPSYSLDTLTRTLKIQHKNKHRALSDTIATQDLFTILHNKIKEIPPGTMNQIHEILNKSTWALKSLFLSQKSKKIQQTQPQEEELTTPPSSLTEKQFESFFNQDGPLSKVIKEYEDRKSQQTITKKILESFHKENHLLIEAGTGTGKTVAYLLAAIYFAQTTKQKVVISTYTKNLQEQIINKDIPLLKKALKEINKEIDFSATILKGRTNYVSIKRVEQLMQKPILENHEVTFLIKIILWLKQTKTGDLDEVNIQGKEYSLRFDICYEAFEGDENDPYFRETSFLRKARRKAEQADIIIVNHALLIQDAITNSILPEYKHIIFDEAHNLEKVTTSGLSINLSYRSFSRPFERFSKIDTTFNDELKKIATMMHQALTKAEIFFGILGIFMEKHANAMEIQYQYLIREDALNSIEWTKVKDSATQLNNLTTSIIKELSDIKSTNPETQQEIKSIIYDIEEKRNDLKTIFLSDEWKDRIQWTYKTYEGSSCLKSAPMNVGQQLKTLLLDSKKSVVLMSATLQTENSFNFIRQQLNLDESVEEVSLPSHFDYPDQVKIIIPDDLPRPATEGYFNACSDTIERIIKANKGRTLVLFTSKRALTSIYMNIAPKMKQEGYEILAQSISGGKGKILEHFKEEPENCALFGTASFWEGIDIPGDLLTCIVMQKLPFDPPNDPIIFSRGQQYQNPFNEYQIPLAILKFKQGFGRLIRTSKDKGSMVILDSRILQNSYGYKFINSLPKNIKLEYGNSKDIENML